jgi:hypothetical protein
MDSRHVNRNLMYSVQQPFDMPGNPFALRIIRKHNNQPIFDTSGHRCVSCLRVPGKLPCARSTLGLHAVIICASNGSSSRVRVIEPCVERLLRAMLGHTSRRFVFKDQYIELSTSVPADAELYGLGETTLEKGIALPRDGKIITLYNRDIPSFAPNANLYGSHPFLMQVNKGAAVRPRQQRALWRSCCCPLLPCVTPGSLLTHRCWADARVQTALRTACSCSTATAWTWCCTRSPSRTSACVVLLGVLDARAAHRTAWCCVCCWHAATPRCQRASALVAQGDRRPGRPLLLHGPLA